jgi:hypothetical protein
MILVLRGVRQGVYLTAAPAPNDGRAGERSIRETCGSRVSLVAGKDVFQITGD